MSKESDIDLKWKNMRKELASAVYEDPQFLKLLEMMLSTRKMTGNLKSFMEQLPPLPMPPTPLEQLKFSKYEKDKIKKINIADLLSDEEIPFLMTSVKKNDDFEIGQSVLTVDPDSFELFKNLFDPDDKTKESLLLSTRLNLKFGSIHLNSSFEHGRKMFEYLSGKEILTKDLMKDFRNEMERNLGD